MIKLIPFTQEVLNQAIKWHGDSNLLDKIDCDDTAKSPAETVKFFDELVRDPNVKIFGVTDRKDFLLGYIMLKAIDFRHGTAELHTCIAEKASHGYGVFAIEAILKYGFYNLGLNRIQTYALSDNESVLKQMNQGPFGFRREGTYREMFYKKGKYIDVTIYSVLKEEFKCQQS